MGHLMTGAWKGIEEDTENQKAPEEGKENERAIGEEYERCLSVGVNAYVAFAIV